MNTWRLAVCLFVGLAALLTLPTSASAQTDWTFCAWEDGVCAFTGTKEVRYGANGSYFYKTLSNGTPCTNGVFGDPIAGPLKACSVRDVVTNPAPSGEWTFCASEYGNCAFTGTQEVRYGANGSYVYKTLANGTACTNEVFGDPAVGAFKTCATRSANWTVCAAEGGFCAFSGTKQVRYGANGSFVYKTLSDGTACTNSVFGDPAVGALKYCATSETTLVTTPVPTSSYGPTPAISCPSGAVDIFAGIDIQGIVNLHAGNTTFCLRAGIHYRRSSITPKTGNTFVGEYGAILDGTGWTTTDDIDAAFRAYNQDIDHVTIRNLVIRNMRRGIQGLGTMSDHWTIEHNDIGPNHSGIVFPSFSLIRNNHIHDNPFSGYMGVSAHNSLIEGNEIARNGWEQKIALSNNVTFRNNFVHHNSGAGIWYDTDNTGAVIEGNRVEDNGWIGIFYEISTEGIIRNNTIRRNGDAGVFLGTSKNTQIYNNTLENNFRAITYFLNCSAVGGGSIGWDLANNTAHDNTITLDTQSGALAGLFSYYSECTATYVEPYKNGLKNLTFSNNSWDVPSPATGRYWYWVGLKSWTEWQALGNDATGTAH